MFPFLGGNNQRTGWRWLHQGIHLHWTQKLRLQDQPRQSLLQSQGFLTQSTRIGTTQLWRHETKFPRWTISSPRPTKQRRHCLPQFLLEKPSYQTPQSHGTYQTILTRLRQTCRRYERFHVISLRKDRSLIENPRDVTMWIKSFAKITTSFFLIWV